MPRLTWDDSGKHIYEMGVNQGVLYPWQEAHDEIPAGYKLGVPWNGLTNISESPEGAEATDLYADNIKYLSLTSAENYKATIECYTYPDEFAECNGEKEIANGIFIGQQTRKSFGLCYKTIVGNDEAGDDFGYKLHLVYGCKASPSEKAFGTINDSPEAITFSFEVSTTPVAVEGFKPTATLVIDSRKVSEAGLTALENALYGTAATVAYLPTPNEVVELLGNL